MKSGACVLSPRLIPAWTNPGFRPESDVLWEDTQSHLHPLGVQIACHEARGHCRAMLRGGESGVLVMSDVEGAHVPCTLRLVHHGKHLTPALEVKA